MTDLLAPDSPLFKVGDLVRIKEGSWWLKKSPTFRGMITPDCVVLVTEIRYAGNRQFFCGTNCTTNESLLWTSGEFELVSRS